MADLGENPTTTGEVRSASHAVSGDLMEIIQRATELLLEEATLKIIRSGYSTIIKESRDLSVALHDRDGNLVAQPIIQPAHLAVLTTQTRGVIRRYGDHARPGQAFIANHPYEDGQNHASDVTIVTPVFSGGELVAWCANTAHKPDIGGKVPGSNAGDATDTIQEGLLIPPLPFVEGYRNYDRSLRELIRANSRTPEQTLGDIGAQVDSGFYVERKLDEICRRHGAETVTRCWRSWVDLTERVIAKRICDWMPSGEFTATDHMDDDGIDLGRSLRVSVKVSKNAGKLRVAFESSAQALGPINVRPCMLESVVYFAVKAIFGPELPNNAGVGKTVQIEAPCEGALLNPRYLAAVNMYSMTLKRASDVLLLALAQALPDRVPAAESGFIAGVLFSTRDPSTHATRVHYENVVGGAGGRPTADGPSQRDSTVINVMNTPAEALEIDFPIRLESYRLRTNSAGQGKYRGGLGVVRSFRIIQETNLTLRSDRQKFAPQGVHGGGSGQPAACILYRATGEIERVHSKVVQYPLHPGDVLELHTPGGGGWGRPEERSPELSARDERLGYIVPEGERLSNGRRS
jgi:N-methylhydantoinase B